MVGVSGDKPVTALVPYEIGYGKPPAERQFQPGTSGNPGGRPRRKQGKGSATPDAERAKTLLLEEAYRPITIREGDRTIEVPAIQAVFRAMGVSAIKGNRFAQKTLAELVGKVEAGRTEALTNHFAGALEHKIKWEQELERCRKAGLPAPEPMPHPDDILLDARAGTVKIVGPMTGQEKAWYDHTVALMKLLQFQVSTYAAAARRARSQERRNEHLAELHDYQRQFDQINDVIAPRYQVEVQDRSYHSEATRSGDFAKKTGISLPGPRAPKKFPDEVLKLIEGN